MKSTELLPAKKHNKTLLIKQPIRNSQRIKLEQRAVSVGT